MSPDNAVEGRITSIEEKMRTFSKAMQAIEAFSNQQRQVLLKALSEGDKTSALVERLNTLEGRFVRIEQEGLKSTEDYLAVEERMGRSSQENEGAIKAISDELRSLRESLEIEIYKSSAKVEKKVVTRLEPIEKGQESITAVRDRITLLEKLVNNQLTPISGRIDTVQQGLEERFNSIQETMNEKLGRLEEITGSIKDFVPEAITHSQSSIEERIDARIGARMEALENRAASFSDITKRMDTLEDSLNKQVSPLRDDVAMIKEKVTLEVDKTISRVESRVDGKLDPLSTWVSGLNKKVESVEKKLQSTPDLEARLTRLEGLVESQIAPLGEKLSALETTLGVDVDDSVNRLEERVDARMSAAENRLGERLGTINTIMDDRFSGVDTKLNGLDETTRTSEVLVERVSRIEDQLGDSTKVLTDRVNSVEVLTKSNQVEAINRIEDVKNDGIGPMTKDLKRVKEFMAKAATSVETAAIREDMNEHGTQIRDLIAISSKLLDQFKGLNTIPPRITKLELKVENLDPLRTDFQNVVTMTRKVGRLVTGVESRISKNERELKRFDRTEDALTTLTKALGDVTKIASRNELELGSLRAREVPKTIDEHEKRIDDLFRLQQKVLYTSEDLAKKVGVFQKTLGTGTDLMDEVVHKVERRLEVFEKEMRVVKTENESIRLSMGDAISAAADLEDVKKDVIRLRVRQKKLGETLKSMKDRVSMVIA
ncbi:MAG: hypothetical protein QGG26_08475 [Candidatus Undinarchaeales archaeon]|nr:hypothetical protein [Candidatus Undinarchaeales archaeon]